MTGNGQQEDLSGRTGQKMESPGAAEGGGSRFGSIFSEIADVMDIAMWELDRDYRVVAVNRKAIEIYGEAANGNYCFSVAAGLDEICPDCPAKVVFDGRGSGRSEHRRIDRHGRTIFIDHIATPIRDASGNITGALVLIIDITARKEMEAELKAHRRDLETIVNERTRALRKSEERYRIITGITSDFAYAFRVEEDGALAREWLTGDVLPVTGYTREELTIHGGWDTLVSPSDQVAPSIQLEKLLSGEPCTVEYRVRTKSGEERWFRDKARPVKDPETGRVTHIFGAIQDIDVQRKAQQEKERLESRLRHAQKMEAIGTLSGGIAHDFNNLLMGVQGNASLLLLEVPQGHPYHERLKSIEQYVQRGMDLTQRLLGLARGGEFETRPTDIAWLVENSADMFGRTRKEITVRTRIAPDLRAVEVDGAQIEQVLLNLYVNAWQAMQGGGDIAIEASNTTLAELDTAPHGLAPGDFVRIDVSDTGVGMDKKTMERIFDPFFTTKGKRRGTGLGLASCYGIIKNHGGNISATSNPGRGTVFTIMLPASDKAAASIARPSPELIKGKETVLLVDDEEMILNTGRAMLEQIGYSVLTADSGMAAVDIVSENGGKIDLVVLDMIMPKMGGRETFEQIKKHRPDLRVLLSSGYSIDGQAGRILEQGCDGFIQKPFTLRELSAKVREVLDVRRGD